MRFLRLTAIGEDYETEEGTSGERRGVLNMVSSKLQAAQLERDMIKSQLDRPAKPGAVPARPASPSPTQPGTQRPGAWAAARPSASANAARKTSPVVSAAPRLARLLAKLTAAEEKVRFERLRLERQGCVLRPDGTIVWSSSTRVVEYDHDLAKQGMTKADIRGGKIFLGTKPLDTRDMVTQFSGAGYAIYVVSANGNLHISSHSVGNRHHSSLLAGKPVAGAGEMKCAGGRLEFLSNKSGHYAPSIVHLCQVIHLLLKNGVARTFTVKVLPDIKYYSDVDAFLATVAPKDSYEVAKLCRYAKHLTDETLGQHQPDPWRTADFDHESIGVYSAVTDQMIPHHVVRQWLKSQGIVANQLLASGAGR